MQLGLEGKAFVVTGASKGIGAATAELLSAEGADVLLVARDPVTLEQTASQCEGRTATLAVDVTAPGAGERIITTCVEAFGGIGGLVNNAGAARVVPPEELTDDDWQGQLELNVLAPMRLMRAAAPLMAQAGWGRIVNVCSSTSRQPSRANMAYSVAKAAQLSLSRAFADEWAGRGVRVNAVTPGVVESAMWLEKGGVADQFALARGVDREQVLADARNAMPIGRLGTELEIAAVIAFLCSELASNVAGAAWSVDGGEVPTVL